MYKKIRFTITSLLLFMVSTAMPAQSDTKEYENQKQKLILKVAGMSALAGIVAYKFPCFTSAAYMGTMTALALSGYLAIVKKIENMSHRLQELQVTGGNQKEIEDLQAEIASNKCTTETLMLSMAPHACLLLGFVSHCLMR